MSHVIHANSPEYLINKTWLSSTVRAAESIGQEPTHRCFHEQELLS